MNSLYMVLVIFWFTMCSFGTCNYAHWIMAVTISKMEDTLMLGYPGVLIWEMPNLLQIYHILLCKQNILFCNVELVLKCLVIMYAVSFF
jgi:hypothetical protein